jgi:hypothetical protein
LYLRFIVLSMATFNIWHSVLFDCVEMAPEPSVALVVIHRRVLYCSIK